MNESLGGVVLSDTRDTVDATADAGGASDIPTSGMGPTPHDGGVDSPRDESVGYRIRILEPVEVSSPLEIRVYPDRDAAITTVQQIATKLGMRGFTTYRIHVLGPDDHVVWTMRRTGKEPR